MPIDKISSVQPVNRYESNPANLFRKGEIFRATVVDTKDGQALLRVKGELQTAVTSAPLEPGETALFLVKDIQDQILVLKKQESFSTGFGEKTFSSLLRELGLTVSPEGQKIVGHLLSKEFPLSKKLIEYILKGLNRVPENMKESFIKISVWLYGAGIKDPESYQNILKTLLYSKENLKFLADLIDSASDIDPDILKKQLAELVMAQRDINRIKQENPRLPDLLFYPLLLSKESRQIPAQLYLVMKNKTQVYLNEFLSLFLSVKGEKMGMLWFEIKVQDTDLNITAYTENREVSDYLAGTWTILKDALENHNFRVNSFICREKSIASVFELADELGQNEYYRTVDIKI
ncbi:MAG: hypothetical protein AAGU27_03275 [Dehalobacterium sp.]